MITFRIKTFPLKQDTNSGTCKVLPEDGVLVMPTATKKWLYSIFAHRSLFTSTELLGTSTPAVCIGIDAHEERDVTASQGRPHCYINHCMCKVAHDKDGGQGQGRGLDVLWRELEGFLEKYIRTSPRRVNSDSGCLHGHRAGHGSGRGWCKGPRTVNRG